MNSHAPFSVDTISVQIGQLSDSVTCVRRRSERRQIGSDDSRAGEVHQSDSRAPWALIDGQLHHKALKETLHLHTKTNSFFRYTRVCEQLDHKTSCYSKRQWR